MVCCEPTRQLSLVQVAAQAGRPVLCEKPFGTTLAEAEALLRLAGKVPISVAFPVRYHPAAVQLRQAVQRGDLGATRAVWATNRNCFPGGWFADPALAGGGCLLDHVVHVADLLRWIWGTEYASVMAEAGALHTPGLKVEDTAMVLVECTNGMIVTINPSMSRPRGMPGALDLVMKVWGNAAVAKLDVFAEVFESVDDRGALAVPLGRPRHGLVDDRRLGSLRPLRTAGSGAGRGRLCRDLLGVRRAAGLGRSRDGPPNGLGDGRERPLPCAPVPLDSLHAETCHKRPLFVWGRRFCAVPQLVETGKVGVHGRGMDDEQASLD